MYNRYIPQSDGSYQRSRMPDQISSPPPPQRPQTPTPPAQPTPPQTTPVCPLSPRPPTRQRPVRPSQPCRENRRDNGVLSFLRQLLPRDFDTSDLIIVLLLLLMSNDCPEDQNSALLTLALYLFM